MKPARPCNDQSNYADAAGAIMVVNDFWEMAIDLDCGWIHLGQEDLDDADMAAIRRAGLKIGISTHDEDELDRALAEQPDYVALGPVYPTILKKMKWVEQGLGSGSAMEKPYWGFAACRDWRHDN
jgi:thiamine-phosphate diphosphorylase